jgi:FecR protein
MVKRTVTLAALLFSTAVYAEVPKWTVSESSGSVIVMRPGFQAAAVRGGDVVAGDTVSTGRNGRAVLIRGEEYLVVSPNSRIVIATPKEGSMTQIIQSVGNTLFKIKKMATPHFAVETPYLAAVVKGTTFSVTVTKTGASVQVTEGRVQVATPDGGAMHMVVPGEIGLVSASSPYRLTIQGRETVTIESPNRGSGDHGTHGAETGSDATFTSTSFEGTISEPVGEGPVRLDALSGGLVGGDSTLIAAVSTSSRAPAIADSPSPAPADGGLQPAMTPDPATSINVDPTPAPTPAVTVPVVTNTPEPLPAVGVVEPVAVVVAVNDPGPAPNAGGNGNADVGSNANGNDRNNGNGNAFGRGRGDGNPHNGNGNNGDHRPNGRSTPGR